MWVATKTGFISIVKHRNGIEDTMLVRGRLREDLERSFPLWVDRIEDDPRADYRWRVEIPRSVVAQFVADSVEEIEYDSHVKEEISKEPDGKTNRQRYNAYMNVWSDLHDLQTGGRYASWAGKGGYDFGDDDYVEGDDNLVSDLTDDERDELIDMDDAALDAWFLKREQERLERDTRERRWVA